MWSKTGTTDVNSKSVVKHTENNYVTKTISVRSYEQRSKSVSSSSNITLTSSANVINPSRSYSRLDNSSLLSLPLAGRLKSPSTSALGRTSTSTDARPVNLNYQSPYRGSPTYSSYRGALPSTVKPIPTINIQTPPKKLVVKKTGKFYDAASPVPTYQTHSKKSRGEVLIINNVMFKEKGYRAGAQKDDEKLKDMFKQMGFKVIVESNLKKSAMESKVKSFSKKSSLFTADVAIVVVMSHGTRNESLGGTEIFGLDEQGILVDNLMDYFNESDCKSMANKPKIFIFQCCRGDNEQFVQNDAVRTPTKVIPLTNALIAYSSLPGFTSHRDPIHGTWFISTLCEVFSEHAHEYHVEDLLKMVDMKLNSLGKNVKQTTHYENRGFKRCYLHPI